MNQTPRTDAAILDVLQSGQHYKVKAEFARQLERELDAAIKTINELTVTKDRKSTRLNSSHVSESRMPSSA